jgi:hypothetical protein
VAAVVAGGAAVGGARAWDAGNRWSGGDEPDEPDFIEELIAMLFVILMFIEPQGAPNGEH